MYYIFGLILPIWSLSGTSSRSRFPCDPIFDQPKDTVENLMVQWWRLHLLMKVSENCWPSNVTHWHLFRRTGMTQAIMKMVVILQLPIFGSAWHPGSTRQGLALQLQPTLVECDLRAIQNAPGEEKKPPNWIITFWSNYRSIDIVSTIVNCRSNQNDEFVAYMTLADSLGTAILFTSWTWDFSFSRKHIWMPSPLVSVLWFVTNLSTYVPYIGLDAIYWNVMSNIVSCCTSSWHLFWWLTFEFLAKWNSDVFPIPVSSSTPTSSRKSAKHP